MPRIIFKCGYIKNNPEHVKNLVGYIGTREGVEKLPRYRKNQPATLKQTERIKDILRQFPDSKSLFEYEDYKNKPTLENASEFLTATIDHNLDQLSHQEVYVNYIATRPRVEKLSSHGLFTDEDQPLILSQVAETVAKHIGNIWTPIISMRREDAARLGYDNASAWIALIRQLRNIFAEQMKIEPENLRWYAAFHNESHHPHCHMIIYSVNSREGYVTKQAIEKMRSGLAREIFQQDLLQIYSEQTIRRNALTEESRNILRELLNRMQTGTCDNPVIGEHMSELAERLKQTTKRKKYGYLPVSLKELVNQIVDELAKDDRVAEAYAYWYEMRNEVLHTYKDKLPEPLPLSQQKEFKHIKNVVIDEAVNLGNMNFTFEGDENAEPAFQEESFAGEIPEEPAAIWESVLMAEDYDDSFSNPTDRSFGAGTGEPEPGKKHIAWNDRYKKARTFLYGSDITEPDFEQAMHLFQEEAEAGNALAMHDLGRMYTDGLGVGIDGEAAFEWYHKALSAFMYIEAEKENRYIEYRIGKMHAVGLGTVQDYEKAVGWFDTAVSKNHKYAQYSLAGLYYRGRGVEQDFQKSFDLYCQAAAQHVPYASYELAKMYRDGIGTERNAENSELYFEEAFYGFKNLEEQSHDDKLQYRLGQMLYTGTGTEKNIEAAIGYFEKSARLGNVHAQYMLGKLYLDEYNGHTNTVLAIEWLTKASEGGNDLAQYALGKLYLLGESVPQSVEEAVKWLNASAGQSNQYAQYALGKLYLLGKEVPCDREAAIQWLTRSAEQGNIYAQFFLDHLDSFRDPSLFLAATKLLHYLSQLFREEERKLPGLLGMQVESKLRRKIREKKIAQGHARDDHEHKLTIY